MMFIVGDINVCDMSVQSAWGIAYECWYWSATAQNRCVF